jgi:hypothetical protein
MKYNYDDININDSVFFEDENQSNYDLYWKVIHKDDKSKLIIVQLDEMGHNDERWTISVEQIRLIEKR